MYSNIALALAFLSTGKALLAEAKRLKDIFKADLSIIHIGKKTDALVDELDLWLDEAGIEKSEISVIWKNGDPSKQILSTCEANNIDLLIAGALKQENFLKYYIGSIARRIIRKATCSVLVFIEPHAKPVSFKTMVVDGGEGSDHKKLIGKACELGQIEKTSIVHIVKEIPLLGLSMVVSSEDSGEQYSETKKGMLNDEIQLTEEILKQMPCEKIRTNIKIVTGKAGHELAKFSQRTHADLLIVKGASHRLGLLDRVFSHTLEYLTADLPTNLLIVH